MWISLGELHGFLILKKCVKSGQKSWKNVKKIRKKVGKMCENQFEKLEKCVMLLVLRLEGGGFQ